MIILCSILIISMIFALLSLTVIAIVDCICWNREIKSLKQCGVIGKPVKRKGGLRNE